MLHFTIGNIAGGVRGSMGSKMKTFYCATRAHTNTNTSTSSSKSSLPSPSPKPPSSSPSSSPSKKNLSGLQKDVLSLYRKLLRTSFQKDNSAVHVHVHVPSTSSVTPTFSFTSSLSDISSTTHATRQQFRDRALKLSRRDVDRIEYNIRQGEKHLKLLQMSGVTSIKTKRRME